MKDLLKRTGWSNILVSLIFAILGIILIAQPDAAVKVVTTTLGLSFIIVGAIKIVEYFSTKVATFSPNRKTILGWRYSTSFTKLEIQAFISSVVGYRNFCLSSNGKHFTKFVL